MRLTPRVAGFRSEYPAGFKLECMAGFVGTRTREPEGIEKITKRGASTTIPRIGIFDWRPIVSRNQKGERKGKFVKSANQNVRYKGGTVPAGAAPLAHAFNPPGSRTRHHGEKTRPRCAPPVQSGAASG